MNSLTACNFPYRLFIIGTRCGSWLLLFFYRHQVWVDIPLHLLPPGMGSIASAGPLPLPRLVFIFMRMMFLLPDASLVIIAWGCFFHLLLYREPPGMPAFTTINFSCLTGCFPPYRPIPAIRPVPPAQDLSFNGSSRAELSLPHRACWVASVSLQTMAQFFLWIRGNPRHFLGPWQ